MISQKMLALGQSRSCIRELFEYGMKQAAVVGRENVFDFSIGNPSIPSPDAVNEAFLDIVRTEDSLDVHGYTSAAGYPGVRKAVTDDLNARFDAHLRPENLFFTCGAAPAIISVVRALAVEGAEIVGVAPFFAEYRPYVESNGAKFVVTPPETQQFQIRLDDMATLINEHTQAVLINSPNNPSGIVYTKETLKKLAALLTEKSHQVGHPIYIIADEPYRELVYDDAEVSWVPNIYPNTVVCYSYSKSLSLPGERIGYVCVPDCAADSDLLFAAVAGAARALGHVCPPSLQQRVVARCAAERPDLAAYDKNRRTLYDALTSFGYDCPKANGAFFMFVKAPGGSSTAFSDMAKEKNLLVVPGDDFGCPEYFRLCTCVSYDTIQRSLPLFQELIEAYR
ncbi:pyridoxal phosphate-dependent aminotransferase [Oscillibacter sp.]|uniref:pyridoxal phosphate-dependent aminotransferase n=1 Tax=Oscillibacter sp. TaxID=1945593 RepID=UPI0028B0F9EA|nr:pyridoxal phosphate-dependent aminotransferase [Oscillibacter sp.]